jgi:hypothetical protein
MLFGNSHAPGGGMLDIRISPQKLFQLFSIVTTIASDIAYIQIGNR